MPIITVFRSILETVPPTGSPSRDDYGAEEDITAQIDLSSMVLQQRSGLKLARLLLHTRPDNRLTTDPVLGQAEVPLILADDLIRVESVRIEGETDPVLLFEGFAVGVGADIRLIGEGQYTDRQEVECLSVGVRMQHDRAFQVYGQQHTDPTNAGNAEVKVYGGPSPDYGQTVFNPKGRSNRDTIYTASTVWADHAVFSWPDAAGVGLWTFGQAFAYLLGVHNADQSWVENPPIELLNAEGIYAADYARLLDRVPDSFTLNGMTVLEAIEELSLAAQFAWDITATTLDPPIHKLNLWPIAVGRADKWITLQSNGELLEPLFGEDTENADGTNITVARYMKDTVSAQTAPTGLGNIDKYSITLDLVADWDVTDVPLPEITTDDRLAKYVTSGDQFLTGGNTGYRFVFRRWSANMSAAITTDGWNVSQSGNIVDFSAVFGYANIGRPRPFGRLPVNTDLSIDEIMLLPVVEWRTASNTSDWRPLKTASVRFHTENDTLSIAVGDLTTIIHPVSGVSFWRAALNKSIELGELDLRITAQIPGDRRVLSEPTISTISETAFAQGRVFDQIAQFKKNQNASDITTTVPTPIESDETTAFDSYMDRVRDANAPGRGSGQVTLLTWDDWYVPGDRILGIRGGRDISFQHGTTGFYPTVVQVDYAFGSFSVNLALGDLRRSTRR
jgi:hypothetical protein